MSFPAVSASDLLRERTSNCYSTGSPELDSLFGDGLAPGSVLQIVGPPGSGRERLFTAVVKAVLATGSQALIYSMHGSDGALCTENLTIQERTRLHCLSVTSLTELVLKLNRVETFINREGNTQLFALDGLSALIDDLPRDNFRKQVLRTISQLFLRLSSIHGLMVLISSNVATKLLNEDGSISSFDNGSKAILAPSLGNRDLMVNGERILLLRKARDLSEARRIRSDDGNILVSNIHI